MPSRTTAARGLALGLMAAGLAACATTPVGSYPTAHRPHAPSGPPPAVFSGEPMLERPASPLQCVPFARGASGIDIYGDAHTWWGQAAGRYPRSNLPAEGSVLVMRGYQTSARGHVAVVTQVVSDRQILVDQANWMNGGEITRAVPVLDVSPNNDWSEVRVWWIPTRAWGARTYGVEGFIHPLPALLATS